MDDIISRSSREALGDTKRQCTATNRAGHRCRRAPIPGGFVCANHGGKVPAVQKNARERLLAMVDPALDCCCDSCALRRRVPRVAAQTRTATRLSCAPLRWCSTAPGSTRA